MGDKKEDSAKEVKPAASKKKDNKKQKKGAKSPAKDTKKEEPKKEEAKKEEPAADLIDCDEFDGKFIGFRFRINIK